MKIAWREAPRAWKILSARGCDMKYEVFNKVTQEDLSSDARSGVRYDYFAVLDADDVHYIGIKRAGFDLLDDLDLSPEKAAAVARGTAWDFTGWCKTPSIVGFYSFTHVEVDFAKLAELFTGVVGRGGALCVGPKDCFEEAKNTFIALRDSGEVSKAIARYASEQKSTATVCGFNPNEHVIFDYVGDDWWERPVYEVFGEHSVKEVEGRQVRLSVYVKDVNMGRGNEPYLHWSSPRTDFQGEPDYPVIIEQPAAFVSTQGRDLPENAKAINSLARGERSIIEKLDILSDRYDYRYKFLDGSRIVRADDERSPIFEKELTSRGITWFTFDEQAVACAKRGDGSPFWLSDNCHAVGALMDEYERIARGEVSPDFISEKGEQNLRSHAEAVGIDFDGAVGEAKAASSSLREQREEYALALKPQEPER